MSKIMKPTNKEHSKAIADNIKGSFLRATVAALGVTTDGVKIHEGVRQFGDATLTIEIGGKLVTVTVAVESV